MEMRVWGKEYRTEKEQRFIKPEARGGQHHSGPGLFVKVRQAGALIT